VPTFPGSDDDLFRRESLPISAGLFVSAVSSTEPLDLLEELVPLGALDHPEGAVSTR